MKTKVNPVRNTYLRALSKKNHQNGDVGKVSNGVKYLIGIDEAGRGPLAGPVVLGAVFAPVKKTNNGILNEIRDSKKLSARQRNKWAKIIKQNFIYKTTFISSKIIDKVGITKSIKIAVLRVIKKLVFENTELYLILLDGSLKAPKIYPQQTIIKGDEKIPLISAASIIAKTARDKKMENLHKKMPEYCFNTHKGYGTRLHFEKINKFGLSVEHRKSFCRNARI